MSVTTIYHTKGRNTEDSRRIDDGCEKNQICSICDASFKMNRGCSLEKRCPACRFLEIQTPQSKELELTLKNSRGTTQYYSFSPKGNYVSGSKYILFNETSIYIRSYDEFSCTDTNTPIYEELVSNINRSLSELNEREELVIRNRFGLIEDESARTLEEIAIIMSVTSTRVRQIESSAIKKLKHPKVGRPLKEYIEL